MKLLIITQAVDTEDPVLGFFHGWISALAPSFERVEVICLREGKHALPTNVRVHATTGTGKFQRALSFIRLAITLRKDYDRVFVHMNQEYLLLAGLLWKTLGKRAYLWRNHYDGSWLTDLAASFCTKVFCTSMHSYTAKYRKTVRAPVGVELARFEPVAQMARPEHSILFFGRIAPSKRPDLFLDALKLLTNEGITYQASIVGSPLPKDEPYHRMLEAKAVTLGISDAVSFRPGVSHEDAPAIFGAHALFVNTSPSGMFDKTLFEAAASGCVVLAASDDWKRVAGEEFAFDDVESLARRLKEWLATQDRMTARVKLGGVAREHSLDALIQHLVPLISA